MTANCQNVTSYGRTHQHRLDDFVNRKAKPRGKVENLLWRAENLEFPPAIRQIVILCGTNNIESNTANDIANGLLCSALTVKKRNNVTNVCITGLLPRDFRKTHMRNNIKEVNELIRVKCLSISTPQINYIEQDHDWIDEENCLRTKYYYRDRLHLVELGNKKLSDTITKAIKHLILHNK